MSSLYQASIGIGLTSSAYLVFSQIGAAQFGVMPLILDDSARRQAGLNVHQSVRVWDSFFTKATMPVAVSIMVQSISYATAAYLRAPSSERSLLWFAAATGFLPLPFTLTFILPSIQILQKFSQRPSGESLSDSEEKVAMEKLNEWNNRHSIRMGIYLTCFAAALLAIVPGMTL